jgi:hypothetical protein
MPPYIEILRACNLFVGNLPRSGAFSRDLFYPAAT